MEVGDAEDPGGRRPGDHPGPAVDRLRPRRIRSTLRRNGGRGLGRTGEPPGLRRPRPAPPRRPRHTLTPASAAFLLSLLLSIRGTFAAESNWPRWRGPTDTGSTDSGAYPVRFDSSTNVLWKIPLEEKGCSTPIAWDGRIYLTTP